MRLPQALFYLFLALVLVIILTGCATKAVPVTYKFPEAPGILLQSCEPPLEYKEQTLSGIIQTTSDNLALYHNCRDIVESWNEWYREQKQIADEAAKK